jgi:hypothetical protein
VFPRPNGPQEVSKSGKSWDSNASPAAVECQKKGLKSASLSRILRIGAKSRLLGQSVIGSAGIVFLCVSDL